MAVRKGSILFPSIVLVGLIAGLAVVAYTLVSQVKVVVEAEDITATWEYNGTDIARGLMPDYDYLLGLEDKLLNTTNRLVQEAALRSIWWFAYDSPDGVELNVVVTDSNKNVIPIPEIPLTANPEEMMVTLEFSATGLSNGQRDWERVIKFVPYHINNIYLLME